MHQYIKQSQGVRPGLAVILLSKERDYKDLKRASYDVGAVSQCIKFQTAKKMNASVGSNILRQINSKLGGSLYHLKFEPTLSAKTMLIGIDVCHKAA